MCATMVKINQDHFDHAIIVIIVENILESVFLQQVEIVGIFELAKGCHSRRREIPLLLQAKCK